MCSALSSSHGAVQSCPEGSYEGQRVGMEECLSHRSGKVSSLLPGPSLHRVWNEKTSARAFNQVCSRRALCYTALRCSSATDLSIELLQCCPPRASPVAAAQCLLTAVLLLQPF